MLCGAVELVEQRNAGRAGPFLERKERGLAARGARARPPVAAREHEVVDHERVLAGSEQVREAKVNWGSTGPSALEHVVLWDPTAWRKRTTRGCHRLHCAAKVDLLLEQPITRRPILR